MKTQVVASSFIRRTSDDKYLLLRRSQTDRSRKGEWDLAGGVVDDGEAIWDGAIREVGEEAGLSQIDTCELLFTTCGVAYSESEKVHKNYIFLYFLMTVSGNEHVTLSFEHDLHEWVTKDQLSKQLKHRAQVAAYNYIFLNKLDT